MKIELSGNYRNLSDSLDLYEKLSFQRVWERMTPIMIGNGIWGYRWIRQENGNKSPI